MIVIQKENPDSWKINFPISKRVFKNESLDFRDFLIDEIISISTKSREIIRNKFILEIPFRDSDMVENLLGFLASRNEVISFSFKSLNSKYIELEYETYLSKTEAEKMLSEFSGKSEEYHSNRQVFFDFGRDYDAKLDNFFSPLKMKYSNRKFNNSLRILNLNIFF